MDKKIEYVRTGIYQLINNKDNNIINIATVAEKQLAPTFIVKQINDDDIVIVGYDDMEKFLKKNHVLSRNI